MARWGKYFNKNLFELKIFQVLEETKSEDPVVSQHSRAGSVMRNIIQLCAPSSHSV